MAGQKGCPMLLAGPLTHTPHGHSAAYHKHACIAGLPAYRPVDCGLLMPLFQTHLNGPRGLPLSGSEERCNVHAALL